MALCENTVCMIKFDVYIELYIYIDLGDKFYKQ